ncbi:biopolymer transporter ExbD [Afifella sp. JA880]|uniref:ExbD/TolR family protein n=1 Tax=Afifella sp. JA880 TaxID=2975280 RepID=UPI0021BAA3F8|nr:biopolymer transporter ExbD [Afifella sp. JA880]MCT8266537.1 biopolymer transporter ExbD [Afifella sp. JA880]
MRISARSPRHRAMSMTPLIDVVFLLLLFFMLASTFARFGSVDVTLARETVATSRQAVPMRNVLISVREDGFYAVDGAPVELAALGERLKEKGGDDEARVIVRASTGAVAQDIVSAVDAARRAAIGPVLLVH